jgi:hypothetical protein
MAIQFNVFILALCSTRHLIFVVMIRNFDRRFGAEAGRLYPVKPTIAGSFRGVAAIAASHVSAWGIDLRTNEASYDNPVHSEDKCARRGPY